MTAAYEYWSTFSPVYRLMQTHVHVVADPINELYVFGGYLMLNCWTDVSLNQKVTSNSCINTKYSWLAPICTALEVIA